MTDDRYVVLGFAHVRSEWSTEVSRWSTMGSIPVEYVKCVGADEVRARAAGGRTFSAALVDGRLPAVDRDLLAGLAAAGIAVVVVPTAGDGRDWEALGAVATLPEGFDRAGLLGVLVEHARPIDPLHDAPEPPGPSGLHVLPAWRGRLVAVTGRPGVGGSTVAAALTQRLADDPRHGGDALLADLCRRAHQALLHDARDVVPGVQELVEAHRTGRPTPEQVRATCFDVAPRRYRLLLGLRKPRDWASVRPRAFEAALDGLRRSARILVADVDDDLEGEAETGSFDLQDRNLMARTVVASADVVVAVATPTITGIHGVVGLLDELRTFGVPGERILVVVNRAPRTARARSEITRVVADLAGAADRPDPHVGPVYVPERRGIEAVHRDLGRFPSAVADPPGRAVLELLDRLGARDEPASEATDPVPIRPGELGHWSDTELPDAEAGS
ncbi:MAG: hypothetical protein KF906_05925 [Actinobacteria bacterium]|nr:hypothetical protein [Actinomycetota bacterium]